MIFLETNIVMKMLAEHSEPQYNGDEPEEGNKTASIRITLPIDEDIIDERVTSGLVVLSISELLRDKGDLFELSNTRHGGPRVERYMT